MKKLAIMAAAVVALTSFTSSGYKVGDKAMDFKLKNTDGRMMALTSLDNTKGFIVVFTCNHCPVAKAYEDRIIALDKKYAPKGYPVVAINSNDPSQVPEDSFENMQKRAKEKQYTFPYLFDETQTVAKAYGATCTPYVFVLQKTGDDYIVKYIGAIDDNRDDATQTKNKYVEAAVDALLANTPVTITNTKAIGCGIKWKS